MPSAPQPAIRAFLLDDHDVVRMGFRELLRLEAPDIEVVGEAASVAGAVAMCPPLRPDVAILDIRLQDGSGIDACREIKTQSPDTACLIFTSADPGHEALYDAVMAGASGWVLKHASMAEVVEAIRTVATGGSVLDPQATARILEKLRRPNRQDSPLDVLTGQEQRILKLIGSGLSNREIGREMSLAEKTVKNYISRIFVKLGVQSRTQAIAYAHAAAFAHRAYEKMRDT